MVAFCSGWPTKPARSCCKPSSARVELTGTPDNQFSQIAAGGTVVAVLVRAPPRSLSAIAPTLVALALAGAIGCEAGLRRRCDELCARYGLCTPGGDGVCVAAGEDCARSDDCRVFGLCSARGGRCEAMRDEPCARSERCRDEARCAARDGACVAATPSCQASAACREDGFCSAVDGRCRARSDADCARSSACSRDHRCRAAALRCVN